VFIVEPTTVEHNAGFLKAMTQADSRGLPGEGITDTIARRNDRCVSSTRQAALRKAGFDTANVHPFAFGRITRKRFIPDSEDRSRDT